MFLPTGRPNQQISVKTEVAAENLIETEEDQRVDD